ncbi:BolA family protein [Litorimonas sp. RW-G-Af-16]|uniref:BolA family protein n=1 Tax=Litorimonas sp. RW-G-Af-16 TaxID=3241168 RepID=UPI00390C900D
MGIIGTAIKSKLTEKFNPSQLEVRDESHKHAGHAGARAHAAEFGEAEDGQSAESHFHVIIQSKALDGLTRLAQHRAVMDALSDEMPKIHAFSLEVLRAV